MTLHILATAARIGYDRLGGLLGMNLLWDLAVLPWVAVAWLAVAGVAASQAGPGLRLTSWVAAVQLVALSAPSALLCVGAGEWLEGRSVSLRDLVRGRGRGLWRAQVLGAAATGTATVLCANAVFYYGRGGWMGGALAGLMLWLLAALELVSLYLLPAAVSPDVCGAVPALRQAAALAAANLRLSAVLLVACALVMGVGLATGLGILAGCASLVALLITCAYHLLLVDIETRRTDQVSRCQA